MWQTWRGCCLRVLSGIHLTLMFFALLQKDLFKGMWSLAEGFFKQNYCHACHTMFAVVFPLPSCCVSSLLLWTVSTENATTATRFGNSFLLFYGIFCFDLPKWFWFLEAMVFQTLNMVFHTISKLYLIIGPKLACILVLSSYFTVGLGKTQCDSIVFVASASCVPDP